MFPNILGEVTSSDITAKIMGEGSTNVSVKPFVADGTLSQDNYPEQKPGVWYLQVQIEKDTAVIELIFGSKSVCAWQDKSGTCKPEVFIQGRSAHVEGVVSGTAVRVAKLTFTEPPKNVKVGE